MAINNVITAQLKLVATGIKEAIQGTGQVHQNLKGANVEAEKLGKQKPYNASYASGGTAGSRAVAAKAAPAGSQTMSGTEYGNLRGSAGTTGASARDFANQAQGLGGLVRLYATYAANVFAVGAAFRALSGAMDTANMVKGLDQLGAASGVALGSLSKRLVQATDGAISLRESMEAVAKASSSGMSSNNILRMGEVAKKASQALGVDMADAVNRITRGITKLEPELLDEIGIFTRIEPAVNAYAKSVGKSASALTDFERRMAFANAVLAEGEQKFGEIDIDTNPYTKLLASIKDLSQTGLELVNKFLAPVIGYMSQSPAALGVAIAGLAAILIKQALPAFGEFKAGLAASADKALELSLKKAEDANAAKAALRAADTIDAENQLDNHLQAVQNAEAKLLALKTNGFKKNSLMAKLFAEEEIDNIKETELKKVEARAKALQTRSANVDTDTGRALRAESAAMQDWVDETRKAKQVHEALNRSIDEDIINREKSEKGWSSYALTLKAAKNAEEAATKKSIVSNAAYTASLVGVSGAFKLMQKDIAESEIKLTAVGKAGLYARGGLAMLAGAAGTVMNALGGVMQVIGLLVAAYSLLDGVLSKSGKELGEFSDAMDRTNSASDTAVKTIERMYKGNVFSSQSLQAQATATIELADSIDLLATSAAKAEASLKTSTWDRIKDNVASMFGGGVRNNFGETFSKQIIAAVEALDKGPIKAKLAETLGNILNVKDISNFKELEKALDGLDPKSEIVKRVREALRAAGVEAGISASKVQEFTASMAKSSDSAKALGKSFEFNTPLTTFANDSIASLLKLSNTLSGPIEQSLASVVEAFEKADKTPIFGLEASRNIASYSSLVRGLSDDFNKQTKEAEKLKKELKDLQASGNELKFRINDEGREEAYRTKDTQAYKEAEAKLKAAIVTSETSATKAKAELEQYAQKLRAAVPQGLSEGLGNISKVISSELAKGSTEVLQKLYAASSIVPELAAKQFDLKNQELGIEVELITSLKKNAEAIHLNTLAVLASQITKDAAVSVAGAGRGFGGYMYSGNPAEDRAKATEVAVTKSKEELKDLQDILKLAFTKPQEALSKFNKLLNSGAQNATAFADTITTAAQETAGFQKKLRDISNQQFYNAEVEKPLAVEKSRYNNVQADLSGQKELLSIKEQILATQAKSNSLSAEEVINKTASLGFEKTTLEYNTKLAALDTEQVTADITIAALRKQGKEADAQKLENATRTSQQLKRNAASAAAIAKDEATMVENAASLLALDRAREDAKLDLVSAELSAKQVTEGIAISTKEAALAEYEKLGLSKEAMLVAKANLDLQRTNFEEEASLNNLRMKFVSDYVAAMRISDATIRKDRLDSIQATFKSESAKIEQAAQLRRDSLKFNLDIDLKNEVFESLKTTIDSIAESFNAMGLSGLIAITSVVSAFTDYNRNIEDNAAKQKKASEDMEKYQGKNQELYTQAYDTKKQLEKKAIRDEITGQAQIAGATKKLFKEKTAAHKLFANYEKALHIQRMLMDMKEMYQKIFSDTTETTSKVTSEAIQTGATEAGFLARAGTYIKEIYANYASKIPAPFGMAAAAAVVATIFGALGGGKGSSTFIPNAEQQQEVQGTAMGWNDKGEKVQVRRGVFGDTEAKSESISKSLEIIRDNSVDGLSYDNKMLKALEAIEQAITGVSKAAYRVEGLRTGSAFGTSTATTKSGGLLGTGLFGSSTSANIKDSGIVIQGSFDELSQGMAASAMEFFEVVEFTKKKWYGSKKVWTELKNKAIEEVEGGADLAAAIGNVFAQSRVLITSLAEETGMTSDTANQLLSTLKYEAEKISARGLSGEELTNELNAVISTMLDDAAYAVFSSFDKYSEFGEGMLETVVRVIDTNDKVSQALYNLGISTSGIGKNYDVSEDLVELAGGIEEFVEKTTFFAQNFLTEEQRLAPIRQSVNTEMARLAALGYTSADGLVDTNAEFVSLVQSLDLTTVEGRNAYTSLMNVAEGFDKVYEASEDTLQAMIDIIKESVQLTSSSLSSMFKDIIKTANSSAEAYTMAQTKASQMMYDSVVDMALNAVGKLVFDAVIQPVADYAIRAATQAATTTVTGSTTSAAVLVAGGTLAGEALANVITKATGIISTMAAVLNDPTFQGMVSNLSGTIGTIAATSYTSTKNTSISGGYSYGGGSSAGNVDNILNTLKDGISSVGREISKLDMNAYEAALSDINYQTSQYISQLVEAGQATAGNIALARQWGAAQVSLLDAKNLREANNIFKGMNTELTNLTTTTTPLSQKISAINSQTTEYVNRLESLGQATAGNVNKVNDWAAAMIAATKAASLAEAGTIVLGLETEVAELGMSELEKQLSSVSTRSTGYITQLTSLGMTLEDATLAVNTWSSAIVNNINTTEQSRISKELSDNSKSASDMLKGLASEVSKLGMTDLEIELYGISTQTQDYLDQLNELGQATTENISAVMAWSNAMRENTIAAKARESDEKAQNAILELTGDTTGNLQSKFDTLQDKFSALGLSVPSTASSFANLISQINVSTTAGRNLRDSLVELVPAFNEVIEGVSSILRQSFEERQNELISSIDKFKEFATSIKEFKRSLILGELSPLTPQQKYEKAQQDFISISSLAQQGDVDAIAKLSTVSESYLQASQAMNASSQQYIDDFNTVLGILDSTESVAELQMHTATDTLAEVRNTVSQLISIDSSINTVNTSIIGLGTALTGAISLFSSITGVEAVSYDANSYSLPQFAVGTNFVPEDMVAQIHKGERIIPAADNLKLEQALNSNNDENLLQELRLLNKKIESLEATVAEGASMNVKATNRNTEEVSNSVKEASSKSVFATKLERKVSLT